MALITTVVRGMALFNKQWSGAWRLEQTVVRGMAPITNSGQGHCAYNKQ